MISALETEPDEDEPGYDKGRREPNYGEASFGLEDSVVPFHV